MENRVRSAGNGKLDSVCGAVVVDSTGRAVTARGASFVCSRFAATLRREGLVRVLRLIGLVALALAPLSAKADSATTSTTTLAGETFATPSGLPPALSPDDFLLPGDGFAASEPRPALSPTLAPPLGADALLPPGEVPVVPPAPPLPYEAYDEVLPPVVTPYPCPNCRPGEECRRCDPCCEPWYRLFDFGIHSSTCGDPGIGQERVMLAPFFLGVSQPFNNFRVEYESVWGMETPNRSEYLWPAPPKGPEPPEQEVDYLDLRLVSELAPSKSFSITTAVPLRSLDPEINPNTTGLGDMSVATKLVILDGRYWQFTQLFKTHINTGSPRKGLGTGHVSLEPGILGRYEWNPRLYFHGRLAFWVPVAGDPQFSGPAVNYGLGASYVAYETDTFAVLPTVEMIGWTFLDGMKTLPNGEVVGVDGEGSFSFLPGTRFVLGPQGDLGLFEVGVAGGLGFDDDGWYDGIFRTELRWSY